MLVKGTERIHTRLYAYRTLKILVQDGFLILPITMEQYRGDLAEWWTLQLRSPVDLWVKVGNEWNGRGVLNSPRCKRMILEASLKLTEEASPWYHSERYLEARERRIQHWAEGEGPFSGQALIANFQDYTSRYRVELCKAAVMVTDFENYCRNEEHAAMHTLRQRAVYENTREVKDMTPGIPQVAEDGRIQVSKGYWNEVLGMYTYPGTRAYRLVD